VAASCLYRGNGLAEARALTVARLFTVARVCTKAKVLTEARSALKLPVLDFRGPGLQPGQQTRYSPDVPRWTRIVPLIATLAVVAIPLGEHARTVRAEAAGLAFLQQLAAAQQAFRKGRGGFAATLDSLTRPCPGDGATVPLGPASVRAVIDRGFDVVLRPSEGATPSPADCLGLATTTGFYAAVQPSSIEAPPHQAYATTGVSGRIFVFFDGIAPLERDMAAGGLATPVEALAAFKIP
jgi:hypothetical protein